MGVRQEPINGLFHLRVRTVTRAVIERGDQPVGGMSPAVSPSGKGELRAEMQNLAALPERWEQIVAMRQQVAEMVARTGPGPYAWCLEGHTR